MFRGNGHGTDDGGDVVLYKGLRIPREKRLEQMRQSQKRLTEKRRNEMEALQQKNKELEVRVGFLESQLEATYRQTDALLVEVVPSRCLGENLFYPSSASYSNSPGSTTWVASSPAPEPLAMDGDVFIREYLDLISLSLATLIKQGKCKSEVLRYAFRFTPHWAWNDYVTDIRQVLEVGCNENWQLAEQRFPKGALTPRQMWEYIEKYSDPAAVDRKKLMDVLMSATFATVYGPAIFVDDVHKAMTAAIVPPDETELDETGKLIEVGMTYDEVDTSTV
jgi:hypothetical protein